MTKSTKRVVSVKLGELESEKPYIVDLVNNPVVTIVGGTGSGKSLLTYNIVDELVKNNTPEEVNVQILDAKGSLVWKKVSQEPHVLGKHSDIKEFPSVLESVKVEHERRLDVLSRKGVDSWEDVGVTDTDSNMPLVVVLVESIFGIESLSIEDVEAYKQLQVLLTELSKDVHKTGIRLVLMGHRTKETTIPKDYLDNSTLVIGMKMNERSDYDDLFGEGWMEERLKEPTSYREAVVTSSEYPTPEFITTTYVDMNTIVRRTLDK